MKQVLKYAGYVLILFVFGYLIWRFSFMIVWVLIAAVLSFIGHPVVRFFDRIKIRERHFPRAVSAALALLIIVIVFLGMLSIFVPLIMKQAETIGQIDVNKLAANLQAPLQWLDNELHTYGMIPAGQTLQDFIIVKAKSVVSLSSITNFVNSFFGVAGSVIVGIFSVLFIAFFFLKDDNMFEQTLLLFIPAKHHQATRNVISDSKNLLMRYFIGVVLELIGVMTIITLGVLVFGIENALLIGFFGGIMNIIPYVGPVIGSCIGIMLGITGILAQGSFDQLLPVFLQLSGVFLVANFVDNNILAPMIYSSSVKAHPLEIFFVIIMGGSLGGILGMLLAIPVYTILRVIAKEFFQQFSIVKKLTQQIN